MSTEMCDKYHQIAERATGNSNCVAPDRAHEAEGRAPEGLRGAVGSKRLEGTTRAVPGKELGSGEPRLCPR